MARLGLLLLVLAAAGVSGADLIERSVGETMRGARSIEVIKVRSATDQGLSGVIVSAPRGRAAGTAIRTPRLMVPALPAVGSELLVVCSELFCSWGLDRGGYYELATGFVGHGTVHLPPGIVARRSVALLAAGKAAPDLCLEIKLRFSDEPARTALLRGKIAADTGQGELGGAPLGAAPRKARLLVVDGRTSLIVSAQGHAPVHLTGPEPRQARNDRCLALDLSASHPLARTHASLKRALDGTYSRVVLARGRLEVRRGKGPAGGDYELVVEFDARRGLRFVSPLFADVQPHQNYSPRAGTMLSFPTRQAGRYLGLGGGLGRDPELAVNLARTLHAAPATGLRWPLRLHGINDEGEVIGEVVLGRRADP